MSTYPFIHYDSLLEDATTVTATSTDTGYLVSNITRRNLHQRWQMSSSQLTADQYITITLPSGQAADTIVISGHNLADASPFAVDLEHSPDGASWTSLGPWATPTNNRTWFQTFTSPGTKRYWRLRLVQPFDVAAYIGSMAIGLRLDFTEPMAPGFDTDNISLVTNQARTNIGNPVGSTTRYASQTIDIHVEEAGLNVTDFFAPTGVPSWDDFIRGCWANGRPFWFSWAGDVASSCRFCTVPDKAAWSAPYTSSTFRKLKFRFNAFVEEYGRNYA